VKPANNLILSYLVGGGRKKDWGEARPSPYTVESTPSVPCVYLSEIYLSIYLSIYLPDL
jgi:hypothetical protein